MAHKYLWDTGASFTTITRGTAAEIGVDVPESAPIVALDTAAGRREAPLVYLPAITVAGQTLEGIAVSICDACAQQHRAGLLGLNVIRKFNSQLNGSQQQLQLQPADDRDRTTDIARFVELEIDGNPVMVRRQVHWQVRLHNRGARVLRDIRPRVVFENGEVLRGRRIAKLDPNAQATSLVVGRLRSPQSQEVRARTRPRQLVSPTARTCNTFLETCHSCRTLDHSDREARASPPALFHRLAIRPNPARFEPVG